MKDEVYMLYIHICYHHWTKPNGWMSWMPDFSRTLGKLPGCRRKWPSDLETKNDHNESQRDDLQRYDASPRASMGFDLSINNNDIVYQRRQ